MEVRSPDPEDASGISLTPLVDVVLLVLAFFVAMANFSAEPEELSVNLPESSSADRSRRRVVTLTVQPDGTVRHGEQVVNRRELPVYLDGLGSSRDLVLSVAPDRQTPSQYVVDVFSAAKTVGIQDVGLLVRKDRR